MSLDDFLKSGFTFTQKEYELKLKYIMFNSILSVTFLMLIILGLFRFQQNNLIQAYVDIFFSLLSACSILYIRQSKDNPKKIIILLIVSFFALVSLSFFYNVTIIGSSWFIALLLPSYYLGGIRFGLLTSISSVFSIIILGKISLNSNVYEDYFYILMPLIISSIFIYIYEKRVTLVKKQLELKNISLEEEIELKERLLEKAHYDHLTKLPNRVLFQDRLNQAIIKSNRSQKDFAILFIDLDGFKEINDTHGHRAGDIVLCELASRLENLIRKEDTICRFGGDEFICIIENLDSCHTASAIAEKIIKKTKEPIMLPQKIVLTCSIGISLYKKDTNDEKILLQYADTAMYNAKDLGKDIWQFYSNC